MAGIDIIGDIAIVEMPEKGHDNRKVIESILKTHRHVKTICMKAGERSGKYRLRRLKVIHGKETVTIHREYGYQLKLDVRKAYFSPRESTERQRIAGQVKPGETVLVMFAGIGPFAIAIAKRQRDVGKVVAIEMNPYAVKYMRENIILNKVQGKAIPVLGDVKKKSEDFHGRCDRVIMPLPQEGYKYLPEAFRCLKKGGTIHFYSVSHEDDLYSGPENRIRKAAKRLRRKVRITGRRQVLPYGPRTWKVCIDARVK